MLRKVLPIGAGLLLLLAFGVSGRAQADATPTPDHMMMDMGGTPMPEDDHNHERIPANGATVKIIAPQDGDALERDNVIVRVETTNWPLGEGKHWHLYVNGKEQGMSQGNAPALQARDLQPGANVIEVMLSNELHQELDTMDRITIHFGASDHAADAATTASSPELPAGVIITLGLIVVSVLAILGIGFAVTRKKRDA
jgi:hypothetical protein